MEPSFMEYSLSTQELESVNFFKRLYFDRIGFFEYAVSHRASRIAPEFFIVFLCVQGKGWLELDGKRHAVSPGDVFFSFPGVAHFYGADDDDPWSIYWAHFHTDEPDFIELMRQNGITVSNPLFHTSHPQELAGLFQTILSGIYGASENELRYRQSVFSQLLFKVLLMSSSREEKSAYVRQALEFVENNLAQPLSLDLVAGALGVSKYYLSHLFTNEMGVSLKQYILDRRLGNARFLLESTGKSVGEVARLCGYESAAYFSNAFKKHSGRSPEQYKKLFSAG